MMLIYTIYELIGKSLLTGQHVEQQNCANYQKKSEYHRKKFRKTLRETFKSNLGNI